ncbi:hypothetical protein P5673_003656 [Acropora cervicornis]|uniref:Uncharacterized protein n=1 Tax=Acropora cervicornis TaxID=6130 RepID=A0AAD9VE08_ACRCE|nr:hypothetical protein P5673_003656 [Acropora cervicornis]
MASIVLFFVIPPFVRKKDDQKLHQAEEKEQQQIQPIRIQDRGPVIPVTMRRRD